MKVNEELSLLVILEKSKMTSLRAELIRARIPDDKVDALVALYRKDHPNETASDLFFRISTDRGARLNTVKQVELQLARVKPKCSCTTASGIHRWQTGNYAPFIHQIYRLQYVWCFILNLNICQNS